MTRSITRLAPLAAFAALVSPASSGAQSVDDRPDLVVESFELSHDRMAPDTVVGTTFRIANRGPRDAPTFRIAVYHSDGLVVPRRGNVTRIGATVAYGGLKAGASATFSLPVRVPPCDKCRPGSLYAYADAWGTIAESSEDNNFKAVPIDLSPEYVPNLVIEQMRLVPDRGPIGEPVTVDAWVTNDAPYAARGPVKIAVRCSDDFEVDPTDRELASWVQPAWPASGRLHIQRSLRLDTRCPVHGQHAQIGLAVDTNDDIVESDEDDNAALASYWVFRAPDLSPGQLAVTPSAGPPGAPVLVSFAVENAGRADAKPFRVGIRLSKDARVSSDDLLLSMVDVGTIAAGRSAGTLHREVVIPDLPSGRYLLGVEVDADRANGELFEHNNMKAVELSVRRINLTDKIFFLDKSAAPPGSDLTATFALRNVGTDVASPFEVAFYYSDDPRLDGRDVQLASVELKKLAPGQEPRAREVRFQLPKSAREGYRFILMVTDDGDRVYETDEWDNVALRPLLVGETTRPGGLRP